MRKNKKLLLAAIASMGVLAMGVGATSSFAWYTATQGSISKVNAQTSLTAKTDTIELGGVTFTLNFVATSGKTYHPAVTGPEAKDAYFDGVDLTNAAGQSQYWNGSDPVDYGVIRTAYGSAQVSVTASVSSGDLAAALANIYSAHSTLTVKIKADGNVTVAKTAAGLFTGSHDGAAASALTIGNYVEYTIALAQDGSVSSWTQDNSQTPATMVFYYAVRTNNPTGAEYTTGEHVLHSSDNITATINEIE